MSDALSVFVGLAVLLAVAAVLGGIGLLVRVGVLKEVVLRIEELLKRDLRDHEKRIRVLEREGRKDPRWVEKDGADA